MGHRKKGTQQSVYTKDLKDQMYGRLTAMLEAGKGRSKKVDALTGADRDKIYSYSTYEAYFKHGKYFLNYVRERHPECTTLKAAEKYVAEWLTYRIEHGAEKDGKPLSVWTLDLERQALCKLYQIRPDDPQFVQLPKRRREDIKRSRGPAFGTSIFQNEITGSLSVFAAERVQEGPLSKSWKDGIFSRRQKLTRGSPAYRLSRRRASSLRRRSRT